MKGNADGVWTLDLPGAKPGDEYGIFKLIQALAEYEKAPEQVTNTPEILGKDLFEEIKGDEYSVMGMPIKQLINYYKLNEK